jgi:hypothetical protein
MEIPWSGMSESVRPSRVVSDRGSLPALLGIFKVWLLSPLCLLHSTVQPWQIDRRAS